MKILSTKANYERHIGSCKVKKDNDYKQRILELETIIINMKNECDKQILVYKDKIDHLNNVIHTIEKNNTETSVKNELLEKYLDQDRETIKVIASKSTNTITNSKNKITINNRLDLSYERLAPFAKNYTMEHFKRGSAGIADWAGENFLFDDNKEPLYVCSDKARKNFIYIDEKGNRIRDEHAETLRNQIKPVLENKMKECNKVNYAWLAENDDDNNEFTEKMFKLHKDNREIGPDFDKRLIEITKGN